MTDLAPLKLLAAGGSGGEATYQYPEEVYNAELYAGGQWYIKPAGLVTVNGTITTSNTNPYDTNYDRDGWYSSIFNGTGYLQLTANTEFMNDVTGGPFFIEFWIKTNEVDQEGGQNRTIFLQDTGYGSNYANKIKIDITTGQKIAVYKTVDLGGTAIITSTTSIGDNAWHLINVCRAKGSTTVRLFIDGNADGTATESTSFGTVNATAGPQPRLGAARDGNGRYSGSLHSVSWSFHNFGADSNLLNPVSSFTPITSYPRSMFWVQNWMACTSSVNTKVKSWTNRKVLAPRINAFPAMLTWLKRQNTASTGNADAYGTIHQNLTNQFGYDSLYPALANDSFLSGYSIRAYNDDDSFGGTPNRDYINNKGANVGSFLNTAGEIDFSYIARTFKPAKGFCDILTYEGTGSAQTINHNLGCNIGFMLIKDMDADVSWVAKHVSHSGADYYQLFDTQANQVQDSTLFNSTALTTTQFTVGTNALTNASGHTYLVLMLAAGDDAASQIWGPSSNERMVRCGYYAGNGSTEGTFKNVGFEPATVIIKGQAISGNSGESYWYVFDTTRKFESRKEGRAWIEYNKSWDKVESTAIQLEHNGFRLRSSSTGFNESGGQYIYIAIRGPMRIPSAATGDKPSHFFNCAYGTADTSDVTGTFPGAENAPNFQPDFCMLRVPAASSYQYVCTRKSGYYYRATNHYSAIDTSTSWMQFAVEPGFGTDWDSTWFSWMWKSAPGLTHVAYYEGNGNNRTVDHDLGVVPEMMMCWRLGPQGTPTYTLYWHKGLNGGSSPEDYFMYAQYNLAQYDGTVWNDTAPTATGFTLGTSDMVNKNADEYSMVLFASLAGFQKVGYYTGNGSSGLVIDCGFTAGVKFVMIKRTDSTGNWKQYDTERGLHFMASVCLNANDFTAQADDDFVRQDNSGFKLNTSDAEVNASGGNYIFLAVANDPT